MLSAIRGSLGEKPLQTYRRPRGFRKWPSEIRAASASSRGEPDHKEQLDKAVSAHAHEAARLNSELLDARAAASAATAAHKRVEDQLSVSHADYTELKATMSQRTHDMAAASAYHNNIVDKLKADHKRELEKLN